MHRPHELMRHRGLTAITPRGKLTVECSEVLVGFLDVNVVEALRDMRFADNHFVGRFHHLGDRYRRSGFDHAYERRRWRFIARICGEVCDRHRGLHGGFQLARAGHEFPTLHGGAAMRFELGNPRRKCELGEFDDVQEFGGDRRDTLEPLIQKLFELPGHFREIVESDHAPAALQRVKCASDGRQSFEVARLLLARGQAAADIAEHFVRFLEEHTQELFLEAFVEYRSRLVYNVRRFHFELAPHDSWRCCRGKRGERRGSCGRGRRRGKRLGHSRDIRRAAFLSVWSRRLFGARCRQGSGLRSTIRIRFERYEESLDDMRGGPAPAQHRLEIKFKAAQAFRDHLHVVCSVCIAGPHALDDEPAADRQQRIRLLETQQHQRAMDLFKQQRCVTQAGAFARLTGDELESLLDATQIDADFFGDLRAQLNIADLLREIGAQSRRRLAALGFPFGRIQQPARHDRNLLIEVRERRGERVEDVLDHQCRSYHLDDHVLLAGILFGEACGHEHYNFQ